MRMRIRPVVVAGQAREQPRAALWPVLTHVGLLVGNSGGRLGRKRDELFGPDLGRLEAQAGPAGAVFGTPN